MITITPVCCEPRIGYIQLTAMFEASAAGAQTGAIEHWTCSYCSTIHLEEATPAPEPEHPPVAEPKQEPIQSEVEVESETERSSMYANDRSQIIDHMEEEEEAIGLLSATPAPITPLASPLPTAGPTNPIYETPLYLLSFQKQTQAQLIHEQGAPESSEPSEPSLPLLTSLFPCRKSPPDYQGVFTPRGGRSRAKGLFKHFYQ